MSDAITLTGNIATEPQYKVTPGGLPILSFRLATSDRRFDESTKTWVDGETNWYTVSVFRRMAQHAAASLKKGERVVVSGRLRLRTWEVEGRSGSSAEVSADAIGHDLLFGTTTFHRAERASAPRTGEGAASERDAAWAAPLGSPTEEWRAAPVPADDPGADAAVRAGQGADVPF